MFVLLDYLLKFKISGVLASIYFIYIHVRGCNDRKHVIYIQCTCS